MNFTVTTEDLAKLLDPKAPLAERRDLLLVIIGKAWSDGFDAGVEEYKRAIANAAPMSRPEARA